MKVKRERFAFDEASVRREDADGRLHVAVTNISKANVCPYLGSEIPNAKELGLDEDRVYLLLRDPAELAKGASTFNNLPVLSEHVPVSAKSHSPDIVIGSTGTDGAFEAPFLRNSLVIWVDRYIKAIESGRQKELSSAYYYDADMTPGAYQGESYDGVMRNIVGNHVALVKEGRAGPDVVVGDSNEAITMAKTLLSRKAAVAYGAMLVRLQPKMASDAKVDIASAFRGVTGANFKQRIPVIAGNIIALTKGKLAKDEAISLGDLTEFLGALNGVTPAEAAPGGEAAVDEMEATGPGASGDEVPDEIDPAAAAGPQENQPDSPTPEPAAGEVAEPEEAAWDAEPLRQYLAGKLSAEDQADCDKLLPKPKAMDDIESDEPGSIEQDPADNELGTENTPPQKDKPVTNKAMDAAVAALKRDMREATEAREFVAPYVGKLSLALDSASDVLRAAATVMGLSSAKTANVSALRELIKLKGEAGRGDTSTTRRDAPAMDAAAVTSFNSMFPDAARIG